MRMALGRQRARELTQPTIMAESLQKPILVCNPGLDNELKCHCSASTCLATFIRGDWSGLLCVAVVGCIGIRVIVVVVVLVVVVLVVNVVGIGSVVSAIGVIYVIRSMGVSCAV